MAKAFISHDSTSDRYHDYTHFSFTLGYITLELPYFHNKSLPGMGWWVLL